jgi:hypothetical protein
MAQALQHDPTALIPELPIACTTNIGAENPPSGSEVRDAVVSIPLVQNIRQVSRDPKSNVRKLRLTNSLTGNCMGFSNSVWAS